MCSCVWDGAAHNEGDESYHVIMFKKRKWRRGGGREEVACFVILVKQIFFIKKIALFGGEEEVLCFLLLVVLVCMYIFAFGAFDYIIEQLSSSLEVKNS